VADETITTPPDRSPADQQPAWREDFPIDWPQDQYVERRDFMKFLVLTSGALAVGQLWIAGPPSRPLPRILVEIRGEDVYAIGVEVRTV